MAGSRKKKPQGVRSAGDLRSEYEAKFALAGRLRDCIREQILTLLEKHHITLGVPLEFRVKDWSSIEEKLVRKSLSLSSLDELPDLVGVRAILLFRKDLIAVDTIIRQNFDVLSAEDTSARLEETQFGYQSQHYVVRLLESWTSIPSYSDLGGFAAEIQVRTVAQHIWAAASHKLQYKKEESVPPPLRRAIYRVSALLETVDLEFSRVLEEREIYISQEKVPGSEPSRLNVDLLRSIMDASLPLQNKTDSEAYGDLLEELFALGVNTDEELRSVIASGRAAAEAKDKEYVDEYRAEAAVDSSKVTNLPETYERVSKGHFMAHTGLMRWVMRAHFGDEGDKILAKLQQERINRAQNK